MRAQIKTLAPYAPCTINVRGKVSYSRITHFIDGEELVKANQRNLAKGMPQKTKPHITITLKEPQLIDDPQLPQPVRDLFLERVTTKADGTPANSFTQDSTSKRLPIVAYGPEAGDLKGTRIADADHPLKNELAAGMDVTIGIKLFNYNGFTGTGIEYIILNEPVRYYQPSAINAYFEQLGIETRDDFQTQAQSPSEVVSTVANTAVQGQAVNPMNNQNVQPMNNVAPVTPNVQGQAPTGVPTNVAPTAAQQPQEQPQVQAAPMVDMSATYAQGGANFQPTGQAPVQEQTQPQAAPAGLQYTPQQ